MEKRFNRFLALIMACLVSAMMLVPLSVTAEEQVWWLVYQQAAKGADDDKILEVLMSGKCGDDISWTLNRCGVLRISGSGELNEYYNGVRSLDDCEYLIKEIYIEEGITGINRSFDGTSELFLVTLPESVTKIKANSFHGNSRFFALTILNPDCEIEDAPLASSDNIWIFGHENSTASKYAEKYNYNFRNAYGDKISDKSSEISWKLEGNVLEIGGNNVPYFFEYYACPWYYLKDKVEKVVLDKTVINICGRAFMNFEKLKEVVTEPGIGLQQIHGNAFAGCTSLEIFELPKSVYLINQNAFSGTPWIDNIKGPLKIVNDIILDGYECSGDVVIPDNVRCIRSFSFSHCKNITSVTMPASVNEIEYAAFWDCSSLKSITIKNRYCFIGFEGRNLPDVTIYGYKGSTAEKYANEYGYKFAALDEPQTKTEVTYVTTNTTMTEATSASTHKTTSQTTVSTNKATSATTQTSARTTDTDTGTEWAYTTPWTTATTRRTTSWTTVSTRKTTSVTTVSTVSTRKTTSWTTVSTQKATSATTQTSARTTFPYTETSPYQYSYTVTMPIMNELDKINSYPTKTVYNVGEELDLSGISYTVSNYYYWFNDLNDGGKHTFGKYTVTDPEVDPKLAEIIDENNNKYSGADFSKLQGGKYKVNYYFELPYSPGAGSSGFRLSYDVVIEPAASCTTSNTTVTTNTTSTTVSSSSVTITETTRQGTLPTTGYSSVYKVIAGFAALMTATGVALAASKRKEE